MTASTMQSFGRGSDAATPRTHLRMTVRGRRVLAAVVTLPALAALTAGVLIGGTSAIAIAEPAHVSFASYTVPAGESLWTIAERLAPAEDPREVIADIMSLNQLTVSEVKPGQQLALPAEYAPVTPVASAE